MKRILLSCLALVLVLSLFAGCSGKDGNVSTNNGGMVNGTNDATGGTNGTDSSNGSGSSNSSGNSNGSGGSTGSNGTNGMTGGNGAGGSNGSGSTSGIGGSASPEIPNEDGILDSTEGGSDAQNGGRARTRIR